MSEQATVAPHESGIEEPTGPATGADKAAGGNPFPDESRRPCFVVLDEWAEYSGRKLRPGVWHCTYAVQRGQQDGQLVETWLAAPLHIEALTSDQDGGNFGRLLRFRDSLGNLRQWAMPMEMLAGDGVALRSELLAMGLELEPDAARRLLPRYLQWRTPGRTMRAATRTGWADRKAFVLPDEVIGPGAPGVIFQSGERGQGEHTTAGTLDGWRSQVAAMAAGNPLLMFAISAAFAGPLLWPTNSDGGGFHLVGDSSTGKTTAIEAACSVWGGPNYRRSWRTTANGMEGAAALFNDGLLALDEISECEPRDVGAIVYALANGYGKQRASRTGAARTLTRWRVLALSSGERSIATAMAEGGYRAKAGQSVRLLDVPVARRHGIWDALPEGVSPAACSDALRDAVKAHHGHPGREFLQRLTDDHDCDLCAMLEAAKGRGEFATQGSDGQPRRAAARFALVGLAGELATDYGITGWQQGDAMAAAGECFRLWREERGQGNDERRQIARQLSDFLDRHGDSRFSAITGADEYAQDDRAPGGQALVIRDRAGWWRDEHDGRQYLMTGQALREALHGHDFRRALDVLQTLGVLPEPGSDGKRARLVRTGDRPMRLYPVSWERLQGVSDGE